MHTFLSVSHHEKFKMLELKEKLEELIKYKSSLGVNQTSIFDKLIDEIKDLLPGQYSDKLNVLEFYEFYDENSYSDDLPF